MAKKKQIEIESIQMQMSHLKEKREKKHLKHIAPIEDELTNLQARLSKLINGKYHKPLEA